MTDDSVTVTPAGRTITVSADSLTATPAGRTIILTAGDAPFPVVFEMLADTVILQPGESLHLVLSGPDTAQLEIGHGANGVSIFRHEDLNVEVFDDSGARLDIAGF
jgi:hypothetical protein